MCAIPIEHCAQWLAWDRVDGLEQGSGSHFQAMIDAYWRIAER